MKQICINVFILLIFSTLTSALFAQTTNDKINVTGEVVDSEGLPLPGVTIVEKGETNGVSTDFDGKFNIKISSEGTLVFSYVGMKKKEVVVKGKSKINVTLEEDISALDEVVVVGYGTQKKEAITGAVESIKGDEVEDLPVGSLGAALVGRVLGVGVTGGDSRPGQAARLTIRDPTLSNDVRSKYSVALGANQPLYVIDGVVQIDPNTGYSDSTLFDSLDASQVESISFLKDSAAAIYGSRASQGVVLVTTKQGQRGPAKFSYSANFSFSDETYRTKMLNANQYGRVFNIMNSINPEQNIGAGYDPSNPTPSNAFFFSPTELEHFKTIDYDALDEYWTSSGSQRHNINLSGGSKDATYFGGISYYTQDGNLGSLDYNKWSFRAGSNVKLDKGFDASFQVSGFFTDVTQTSSSIGNQSGEDDYRQLLNRTPFMPMYVDGLPVVLNGATTGDNLINFHYGELLRLQNLSKTSDNSVSANLNVKYEVPFIKGLKFNLSYSRQENSERGDQRGGVYNLYQVYGADQLSKPGSGQTYVVYENGEGPLGTNDVKVYTTGPNAGKPVVTRVENSDRLLIDYGKSKNEQLRFQASFERDFGRHSVSALFAAERSERELNSIRVIKSGVPDWSQGMLWQNTGEIDNEHTVNKKSEAGDLGYIGRLNYNYDRRYYGEFLFRSDASAKFAPENYWGRFYSLSGGWIVSNENFFMSNVFDFLKFRASVGLAGNDDIRPWTWLQTFNFEPSQGAVFGGNESVTPGLKDSGQANRGVKWSDELKTNLGIDTKILDNRLSLTFEQYYNHITNSLIGLTTGVPFTVGGAVAPSNYGEYKRWGTEISISWDDKVGADFSYGVTLNTSWNRTKLIQGNFDNEDYWYPWTTKRPGYNDRGTWGYDNLGMFKTQDDIDNYIAETGITKVFDIEADKLKPGMLYYRDIRGPWDPETKTFAPKDGIINEFDKVQLIKRAKGPQGFSSAIRLAYKGLSLRTVLSVNWGGYREVGSAKDPFDSYLIGGNYENRPAFWANMYHPTLNPNGNIPNLLSRVNRSVGNSEGGINTVRSNFWRVSSFNLLMRNINLSYTIPKKYVEKAGISTCRVNLVAMNPFILYNPYKDYGLTPYGSYNNYPVLSTYSLGINIGF
ncbi:SusC/RagA family TonB-linked outer membrane protein [Wenyingzhuangia sp. chi5]|uniref:SusC/RagA family TonB-linked outer membrane protein n=1 Tax=Wenyingzhuangia gilva TaxID=3057677 RepID=A0ABT8VTL7_9FLAO|nr:SusC/RagA family TonB-linked outer membrane protein [Wenyingzhuangia sp. chi5]MDO3695293.1 SusC/RagA family TonB-linked outer membrane protein [Wenyingzhuangia sp. chi5]